MTAVRTLLVFAAAGLGTLTGAARLVADDAKDSIGTWVAEKATLGGKDIDLAGLKLKIEAGGKYTVDHGAEADKGTFTLDAKTTPKSMEIKSEMGPLKGKTIPAIYELKGDTMTVCYDMEMKAKPAKFESPADSQVLLVVYKREKK